MKKILGYLLLLCYASAIIAGPCRDYYCGQCECKATSQTFFSINPVFTVDRPARIAGFRDRLDARIDGYHGAVQFVLYGGQSTRPDRLARYFMPFCKSHLKVIEDENDRTSPFDLSARQFNIYTEDGNFQSFIEFKPKHSEFGFAIDWEQSIYERSDGREIWFNVTLPIEHVTNNINLCEAIVNDGSGANPDIPAAVPNMVQAFKQPSWRYGRIEDGSNNKCKKTKCCRTSHTSLASVDFRIGYDIVAKEECHFEGYIGTIIPAGNSPEGVTVFEPIVGHNKHWGVEFGGAIGLQLWHHADKPKRLDYELNMNGLYLFQKNEVRSFDLKDKPWSRYAQFYANRAQAELATDPAVSDFVQLQLHTPGINILTRCLRIKPRFSRTFNNAITYTTYNLKLEVGYNFFCRQAECADLTCPWILGPALKNTEIGIGNTIKILGGYPITNVVYPVINSTIINYENGLINRADLNLNSATHPGITTHTFYGAINYRWDQKEYPTFLGFGGSYEVSTDNAGLDRWTLWGKFGLSF